MPKTRANSDKENAALTEVLERARAQKRAREKEEAAPEELKDRLYEEGRELMRRHFKAFKTPTPVRMVNLADVNPYLAPSSSDTTEYEKYRRLASPLLVPGSWTSRVDSASATKSPTR